jgi:hypothetical protein
VEYELSDDWNLEHFVEGWIREHGAEAAIEKIKEYLLKTMTSAELGQLKFTASPSHDPYRFSVEVDGPPRLVHWAKALLRKANAEA